MPLTRMVLSTTRLTLLAGVVGVLCGIASALFLWLLDTVTALRGAHMGLVYALPIGGWLLGWAYERWGTTVQAGNNLVLERINQDGAPIPTRMAPMVLLGTLWTHLFGGSAGREGTAVQMGASLADAVATRFDERGQARRALLIAGVAGGFGSVFGTPWAGAWFGIEVAQVGRWSWRQLWPAAVASFVGDATALALGTRHTGYPRLSATPLTLALVGKWLLFALALALITIVFIELTHGIKQAGVRWLPQLRWRLCLGGAVLVVLWRAVGSSDYLGLGVPTLVRAFEDPALVDHAFALKLVFTAITIGCGFIGGEVTPLFFVGATAGNMLARTLGLPLSLGAGVGLATVFGAASNAPIALSIMAVELLGPHVLPHVLLVSLVAWWLCGHRSIYGAQQVVRSKWGRLLSAPVSMRDWAQSRPSMPKPTNGPE